MLSRVSTLVLAVLVTLLAAMALSSVLAPASASFVAPSSLILQKAKLVEEMAQYRRAHEHKREYNEHNEHNDKPVEVIADEFVSDDTDSDAGSDSILDSAFKTVRDALQAGAEDLDKQILADPSTASPPSTARPAAASTGGGASARPSTGRPAPTASTGGGASAAPSTGRPAPPSTSLPAPGGNNLTLYQSRNSCNATQLRTIDLTVFAKQYGSCLNNQRGSLRLALCNSVAGGTTSIALGQFALPGCPNSDKNATTFFAGNAPTDQAGCFMLTVVTPNATTTMGAQVVCPPQ